jgi:PAS domain S-box-containing protein
MPATDRKLRFSYLMMGILFAIIITLVLAGIWTSYETSRSQLETNAARLRAMTESHINNSFRLIDTSLKIYDNTYNDEMEEAFVLVMDEYNRTGGDPSRMDLEGLKSRIGGMDVYVINDSYAIEYTTKRPDLGLDFKIIYPDFAEYLKKIRNTTGFYPDRVVPDWVNRTQTKFSYMPTPDHRYVIELGLASKRFAGERMELIQYSDVVDEVMAFNPYLEEVLVFQKQKRLVDNLSYVPTPEESVMLDYILWENRSTQVVADPARGKTVVWEVVDLRDPDYGADQSRFAKLTYDGLLLADEKNRVASLHAFATLLVLLTGGLLAASIARRVSRPIEQIAADVDAVAAGDLDHAIRPVGGYELSRLAEKTGVMVEQLKEQIRQREASERRFADTVQLLPQAVFETDLEGNVTFANPAALQVVGISADYLGRGFNVFSAIAPADRARAKETFDAILAGGETEGADYAGLRSDGSIFAMLVYAAARYEDGVVAGIRGSVVDIDRLKQIEAEMRRMNAELEERVTERTRDLEAFTYSVSHDLRTPLRAIDGYSAILEETARTNLDEREQHYLGEVRRTVRQMNRLIDGLLALSRLDREDLVREEIAPAALVMEEVSSALERKEREIGVTIGHLPPCSADPAMLRQIWANLIGNAVKFTQYADEPAIEIGAVAAGTETAYFIRDNGVGFDMADAERIFTPFQRLHRADRFEGSGIGLATVERIVRRHGGRIWAESAPGEGATFFFTLPPA